MPPCLCDDTTMYPREYPSDTTNMALVECYGDEWQGWRTSCPQCSGTPEEVCECRNNLYTLYLMGLIICDLIHGDSAAASRKAAIVAERRKGRGCGCGG